MDISHLIAIQERLARERVKLAADPDNPHRQVWVAQAEKELANEKAFLGLADDLPEMTDDELLAELRS